MTIVRRQLKFDSFDEVIVEVERLQSVGYEKSGTWDLAQVCGHLAEWFRYQVDGYPRPPLLLRPLFWTIRNTVGKKLAKKMLAGGQMKPGMPTVPQSVPDPGGDAAAAVAKLKDAIARWENHPGPLHESPLFGGLTPEQWRAGHLIHCAHHLSFLVPKAG